MKQPMEIKKIPIASIKTNKNNPRKISETNEAVLNSSLRLFGQIETLIVDVQNNLISGHQRLKQLQALGETEALVSVYKGDKAEALGVVVNHEAFEGEFEIGEYSDMVSRMPDLPEFKPLEFDKTIRSGNIVLVGQEQVTFGGYHAKIDTETVAQAEFILNAIAESMRPKAIAESMRKWLKDN